MAAAAHDPKFAKKVGIPVSVAKEFNKADAKTGILRKNKGKPKANRWHHGQKAQWRWQEVLIHPATEGAVFLGVYHVSTILGSNVSRPCYGHRSSE